MNESTEENCQQPQQLNKHPRSHALLSECIDYNNDELELKWFSITHINILTYSRPARANHGPRDKMMIGEHGLPGPLDSPAGYF